jgi:signal transduction histidine kinase
LIVSTLLAARLLAGNGPPPDVQFRIPVFWEEHKLAVLSAGCLALLETALVAFLLIERRKRKTSERTLRLLSAQRISAQEEDRRQLARELHDDVNQRLALLSIELDQLREDPQAWPLKARLQQLSAKTASLSTDVHTLARELRPSKLDHLGLVPAAQDLCREIGIRHEIQVDLESKDVPEGLTGDTAICLYRLLQEALQNVVKHSRALQVRVVLEGKDNRIDMKVFDNGAGFTPGELDDDKGFGLGLAGMRERVAVLEGMVVVRSAPGAGTKVYVSVPLPKSGA